MHIVDVENAEELYEGRNFALETFSLIRQYIKGEKDIMQTRTKADKEIKKQAKGYSAAQVFDEFLDSGIDLANGPLSHKIAFFSRESNFYLFMNYAKYNKHKNIH